MQNLSVVRVLECACTYLCQSCDDILVVITMCLIKPLYRQALLDNFVWYVIVPTLATLWYLDA